ncbi:MAG: hypothetical protein WAU89_13385 [Candidatus Acidiferrales bacterium]
MQIFFISPTGAAIVPQALKGIRIKQTHGWRPDGTDKQVIGVVEVGDGDSEQIAEALEGAGILLLPDHKTDQAIDSEHYQRMKQHGVLESDNTKQAMTKVHGVSGFHPLKPKRY